MTRAVTPVHTLPSRPGARCPGVHTLGAGRLNSAGGVRGSADMRVISGEPVSWKQDRDDRCTTFGTEEERPGLSLNLGAEPAAGARRLTSESIAVKSGHGRQGFALRVQLLEVSHRCHRNAPGGRAARLGGRVIHESSQSVALSCLFPRVETRPGRRSSGPRIGPPARAEGWAGISDFGRPGPFLDR